MSSESSKSSSSESSSKSSKAGLLKMVVPVVVVIIAAFFGVDLMNPGSGTQDGPATTTRDAPSDSGESSQNTSKGSAWSSTSGSLAESQRDLVALAKAEKSGQMVEFQARVVKLLPDDNDGSRHQRFILAIDFTPSPTSSILVAHNIDLAPKVPVKVGDTVRMFGQYEWNDRGGVVHWTHHDPGGHHADGWIELDGKRYE